MEFEEIRIENTNRCEMNCFICPRKLMKREKGCMSYDEFVMLCNKLEPFLLSGKLNWLDLHGYGEPLLDKELLKKVSYISRHFPNVKSRIVTTFYNIKLHPICSLLSCGLTEIVISHYASSEEEFRIIHGVSGFETTRKNINTFLSLNHERGNPIHVLVENISMAQLLPYKYEKTRRANISLWYKEIMRLGVEIRDLSSPHNWGSAFSFKDISSGVCSVVKGYRKRVLQITWDGKIIPCCFDYNADVVFGNIFEEDLEGVFSSTLYKDFIYHHISDNVKKYPPCRRCSRCHIP